MSYPPPLYDGDAGESTGGLFGLYRWEFPRGEKWSREEYEAFMAEHDNIWVG